MTTNPDAFEEEIQNKIENLRYVLTREPNLTMHFYDSTLRPISETLPDLLLTLHRSNVELSKRVEVLERELTNNHAQGARGSEY